MDKLQALVISILFLIAFWYGTDLVFNFEIGGFDLPIIGHIDGFKPLVGYIQYSGLIVGGLTLIVFFLLVKSKKGVSQ